MCFISSDFVFKYRVIAYNLNLWWVVPKILLATLLASFNLELTSQLCSCHFKLTFPSLTSIQQDIFCESMDGSYESVLLVKPEVFVFTIPPRTTARGYRYAQRFFIIPNELVSAKPPTSFYYHRRP